MQANINVEGFKCNLIKCLIIIIKKKMSYIKAVIRKCVNDIWSDYDKDGSNKLDRTETRKFVTDILQEMGDGGKFSEEDFEECF